MKRVYSIPAIGLVLCLLLVSKLAKAQSYFSVEIKGKGQPMILIHGLYCSGEVWKETVARYEKNYECHILTLVGFGGIQPNVNDHFLSSVKDDIIMYIKTKQLHKPILIGHSLGGFISYWAASTEPALFGKVIVVDSVPFLPSLQMPGATVETIKPMAGNTKNMMSNLSPDEVASSQKVALERMINSKERIDQVVGMAVKSDPKTQGEAVYELYTTDLRETITSIEAPVLVLGAWIGYKDYGATHESVRNGYASQIAGIKNHQLEIADNAKHFIFYDDPEWFYAKVDSFIK